MWLNVSTYMSSCRQSYDGVLSHHPPHYTGSCLPLQFCHWCSWRLINQLLHCQDCGCVVTSTTDGMLPAATCDVVPQLTQVSWLVAVAGSGPPTLSSPQMTRGESGLDHYVAGGRWDTTSRLSHAGSVHSTLHTSGSRKEAERVCQLCVHT